jgi:hypothetical protein
VLTFLILPVAAIFVNSSPGDLLASLRDEVVIQALLLSLKTTAIALALILALGTPAAYFLATRHFRGRFGVITLGELPLVLPPAVAGIGLLAAIGPAGILAPRWRLLLPLHRRRGRRGLAQRGHRRDRHQDRGRPGRGGHRHHGRRRSRAGAQRRPRPRAQAATEPRAPPRRCASR